MVRELNLKCYAFLLVIVVLHISRTMSQPEFCQGSFDDERGAFLCLHNYVSATVEPTAANMNLYSWEPELYPLAVRLAERCTRGTCIPLSSYNGSIGINVATREERPTIRNGGIRSVVMEWANEKENYDFRTGTCAPRQTCFHYTQVVWARTKYLACAVGSKPCKNGKFVTVCLYSPKGNIKGERPYISGPVCSQCEDGRPNCFQNLCAP